MVTAGSRVSATSIALFSASIMFIVATALHPRLLALFDEVRRHLLVDIVEHGGGRDARAVLQRAIAFRFLARRANLLLQFLFKRGMAFLAPDAGADHVRLQPFDRVAERPCAGFRSGAVLARIVGGGVAFRAV